MSFFNPQNPGIGGIDELTDAEALLVQNLSALGDPGADRILFWDESANEFTYLTAGSGLSITDTTISATGGAENSFATIAVSGQSNVVADSGTDTLTLVAGTGLTITTNATTDTITFTPDVNGSGTTNEISYWVDSNTLGALAVATYPSLTELSYVKGVTSAIQTQLNAKAAALGADDNYVTDAQLVVIGNTSGTNTGDNATNTQYSGLAASKADVGQTFFIGTTQVAINRASAALTLAGLTLTTPDIGTPSAGVLTNCTGLPTAGLVDDSVTLAKMAPGTDGNLITYDANGDPAYVATGTSGQVLTSNGVGAAPTFQDTAGGGFVANGTFSVSVGGSFTNIVNITSLAGDTDGTYELTVVGSSASATQGKMKLMFNSDNAFDWQRYDSRTDTGSAGVCYLAGTAGGDDSLIEFVLKLTIKATRTKGTSRRFYGFISYGNSNNNLVRINGYWNDTTNQLTSIQIAAIQGSGSSTYVGHYALVKVA